MQDNDHFMGLERPIGFDHDTQRSPSHHNSSRFFTNTSTPPQTWTPSLGMTISEGTSEQTWDMPKSNPWSVCVLSDHQVYQPSSWSSGLEDIQELKDTEMQYQHQRASAPLPSNPIAVPRRPKRLPNDYSDQYDESFGIDIENSPAFIQGVFDLFSPPASSPTIAPKDRGSTHLKGQSVQTRVASDPNSDNDDDDDDDDDSLFRKLFVGKVPKGITNEEVRGFFERFGEVECVDVNGDRGCCFVTFADSHVVDEILQKKNVRYLSLRDTDICCRRYVVIEKDKIFVRGLAPETSKDDMFEYFRQFGRIESVTLHKNKSGAHPFGFVRFANKKSVNQIMARNDHEILGKTVHCLRAHRQAGRKDKERDRSSLSKTF